MAGRNKLGQFTSLKPIKQKVSNILQQIAKEAELRVKPTIRDELVRTLRSEMYDSYRPATEKGLAVQQYNKTHKHQKPALYHHTGQLIKNVSAIIDGDTIRVVIKDETYDNGATTSEVYDYLKFGTTDKPKKDTYDYANGTKFSKYISQKPHNFEARTREKMKNYIENLEANLHSGNWSQIPGIDKYIDKVARRNR